MGAETYDVGVVGAGPAGLAAAVAAAETGLSVVLIDASSQPGGQYWRHADEDQVPDAGHAGHHDWKTFERLRTGLYADRDAGRTTYLPNTQVWLIDRSATGFNLRLNATHAAAPEPGAAVVHVSRLILCPGGYDRQLPIPGWDLPGVMAAGGVQALLKGSGTLAGRRAVVAGTGPFLLPVATGLAQAGASVVGICEAGTLTSWLPHVGSAVRVPSKGVEGAQYAALLARYRIRYRMRTVITEIHGEARAEAVTVARLGSDGQLVDGSSRRIDVDLVALGWGFTPSLELPLMVGVSTRRDVDGSLVAVADKAQRTDVDGVYLAGEATGVGGAVMAVAEGRLAALTAAHDAGRQVSQATLTRLQKDISRYRNFAVAMHTAHPVPADWTRWLTPETTVCRCEEVPYQEIRDAHAELGAADPRTLKMLARPGMGWCQGRVCGYAVADITASLCGRTTTAQDLRSLGKRTLAAPASLAELAALDLTGAPLNHLTEELQKEG
ncbi:NAD(P)/FAD-dependent oxidoreductase [Arthrobacter tecti]